MKHQTTFLATALVALPLAAFRPAAEKISFAPAEGATVTKTFTNTMSFGLDDMSMLMNGEENPMMPEIEMEMDVVQTVKVTDEYPKMGEGRPQVVKRTFDEISSEMNMDMTVEAMGQTQEESPTGSGSSDLEGETVTFTWDAEAGEYKVAFAEEAGDEELLANLVEDMDLRGLLPSGEVSVGDSWDIPLINLVDLLAPGGDLKVDMEMDGEDMGGPPPEMMSNVREMFGDMLDGEARATFKEMREIEGARMAVIDLDVTVDTARDMSEFIEELMGEEMPEGMEFTLDRVDVEFALEATGEMLWNLGGGHVHSLAMEGDSAVAIDMEMGMDFGGQSMTMEMNMEMSGTMKTTVETE